MDKSKAEDASYDVYSIPRSKYQTPVKLPSQTPDLKKAAPAGLSLNLNMDTNKSINAKSNVKKRQSINTNAYMSEAMGAKQSLV